MHAGCRSALGISSVFIDEAFVISHKGPGAKRYRPGSALPGASLEEVDDPRSEPKTEAHGGERCRSGAIYVKETAINS